MTQSNNEVRLDVIVGLDRTEMDSPLIRYTHMLCKFLPIECIYFVHAAKTLVLPEEISSKYPDLFAPLDESIEAEMQRKVKQEFTGTQVDIRYVVTEGNPIDKLLHLARIKNPDFIIMGRKQNLKGSGVIANNIARKSPCSLLMVTEHARPAIDKILVPIDFSKHSYLAIVQAQKLSQATGAEILLVHTYEPPTGYYKIGKTLEEFAVIMKEHAENDFHKFMARNNLTGTLECEFLMTDDGSHDSIIYDYAKDNNVDLMIIGSRGRTEASAILIGSMAEKLVFTVKDIPVLITKNTGENMSFLEALMKI